MKTKNAQTKDRNPSNKTPLELASIYYAQALENPSGRTFWDSDICVDLIIDIGMFAGQTSTNDVLKELIDDGDLDEVFGREIKGEEELFHVPGFLVRGTVQIREWIDVAFQPDGQFDKRGPSSDIGRYIIFGYGETLEAAYKNLVGAAIKRESDNIKEGLSAC